jgi:Niemann-Pick C1 protein
LGGKAGYSKALHVKDKHVQTSHFRGYHTPLKSQHDYIEALASAKRISADLEARTGGRVFPYSIFYVYFEQYATIVTTTRSVVALALLSIFLVSSLLLGSWRTGAVVVVTVFMISMNVMVSLRHCSVKTS